jgi:hypothetical protein
MELLMCMGGDFPPLGGVKGKDDSSGRLTPSRGGKAAAK